MKNNKIIKKILIFFLPILIVFACFLLTGCEMNIMKKLEMKSNTYCELGDSIILENSIDNEEVTYKTDSDCIKIVGNKVYGLKIGSCSITCDLTFQTLTFDFKVISPTIELSIQGDNIVRVGKQITLDLSKSKEIFMDQDIFNGYQMEEVVWESSDESIATVTNKGIVKGISKGEAIITATLYENSQTFIIQVINEKDPFITLDLKNKMNVGNTVAIHATITGTEDKEIVVTSSNENVLKVNDGFLVAIGTGEAIITVALKNDSSIYNKYTISVIDSHITLALTGDKTMMQGKYNYLSATFEGEGAENYSNQNITWETSDSTVAIVYDGIVLAVNKGTCLIKATSTEDETISSSIAIEVTKFVATDKYTKEDYARVENIMKNMTLEQKVGQMFIVGFSGTTFTTTLSDAIENYHFGNIIYMGANVKKPATIVKMSNDIQTKMVESNGVSAIISTDQEGGRVARLTTKATHFVSNMAVCATGDTNNSYEIGVACGFELKNYGINMDLAPVLDVNNNPDNPVIGIRSYSDNPVRVALFGNKMYEGLGDSGVIGCVKHFPGHGNTSTDSHTGLPVIPSSKDELYQTELAPFIASISNGVSAIMTTHILFSAIDNEYPATLSHKVLTELLREELGYTGLIVTDGMGMSGVTQFGTTEEIAVMGVKAGIDIFCYTSLDSPKKAHAAIIDAINKGEISMDRINESVQRILLTKLEYGILDDYIVEEENIDEQLAENAALNYKVGLEAVTFVKGSFDISKEDKVLFISIPCSYTLDKVNGELKSNSMACYCATYLNSLGYNCEYYTTKNPVTTSQQTELLEKIKNYDKVIIGCGNVYTTNETPSINFVNNASKELKDKLLVVALSTPYDALAYSEDVVNYVCLYSHQNATIVGLAKILAKEVTATGKLPISEELFQ